MRLWRTSVLVCSTLLVVGASASYAKPAVSDAETEAAREHYRRGTKLYDLGKYDEAISEFQQAYEIKDDPVLLYNIAQSYRLSNKYADALRFYKTYLRRSPNAPNKSEVEQKVADMEQLLRQQEMVQNAPPAEAIRPRNDRPPMGSVAGTPANSGSSTTVARTETPRSTTTTTPPAETTTTPPAETTTTTPEKTEPKPSRTKLYAGIGVAAAGVAILAAGIGLGVTAASDGSSQESLASQHKAFDQSLQDQGQSFQTIGLVLDIVGGLAIAGGAVLIALDVMHKPESETPRSTAMIMPTVGKGSAGAAFTLHF